MVRQLAPVRRVTLSGEVAGRLSEAIRSGELPPGARLPAEREHSVQLGVGRTSIREALRILQATGMVTVRPGDGVFVAICSSPKDQPFARWEALYHYRVGELLEARLAIEPLAAARAASLANDDDLHTLLATLVEFERAIEEDDLAAMVLANGDVHEAITRASRNRMFQAMLGVANNLLIESKRAGLGAPGRPRRVLAKHRAIFDAIAAGDSQAAESAMRDHLMSFVSDMGVGDPSEADGVTKRSSGRQKRADISPKAAQSGEDWTVGRPALAAAAQSARAR
jgi:GntR family transcriptional regulator, transcriptional repressor for pyruvate dehydrogenase complex